MLVAVIGIVYMYIYVVSDTTQSANNESEQPQPIQLLTLPTLSTKPKAVVKSSTDAITSPPGMQLFFIFTFILHS